MSAWNRSDSPHVLRALDSVFSQLGGKPDLESSPEATVTGPADTTAAGPAEIQPPPKVETQADLQAA